MSSLRKAIHDSNSSVLAVLCSTTLVPLAYPKLLALICLAATDSRPDAKATSSGTPSNPPTLNLSPVDFFSGKPDREGDESDVGSCVCLEEEDEDEEDEGPSPPSAQLTSSSRLIDQSQVSAKTGVLTRTLRTG